MIWSRLRPSVEDRLLDILEVIVDVETMLANWMSTNLSAKLAA